MSAGRLCLVTALALLQVTLLVACQQNRDVFSSGWKNPGHNRNASTASTTGGVGVDPPLDPKLLPFSKGPLSFGVGVNLKMAVSRWTDWALDAGVREEKGVLEG